MCVVSQIEQINNYWTGGSDLEPEAFRQLMKLWYQSTRETDETIRRDFGVLLLAAESGDLNHWESSPEGSLALVILLDQFSRNLYRGDARAYQNDASAQRISLKLVSSGKHQALSTAQQLIIFHPFHHAEDHRLQDMAVELVNKLMFEGGPDWQDALRGNLKFMENHRDIVIKFGRFPHRNATLGRESTPDEILYLSQDNRNYGQK